MATLSEFLAEWHSPDQYVQAHTSGSTGTPKPIRLLKADMQLSARATNSFFSIGEHSVLASPLSFGYIAGKMMAVRAIEAHCALVPLPVSNRIELPDTLPHVDLLPIVPSQIESLLAQPAYAARISHVLVGGAAPSPTQCWALTDAGYRAYISFGMTETCSHVALARADDTTRTFHAMPGISFSTDSRGCLAIEAPHFSFSRLQTKDRKSVV